MSYKGVMAKTILDNIVEKEPNNIPYYKEMYDKIKDDKFTINRNTQTEIKYKNLFLQTHEKGYNNAISFGWIAYQFHYYLSLGLMDIVIINVGDEPAPDRKENKNKNKLNKIPKPFSAKMVFKNYLGDGYLYYDGDNFGRTMFSESNICTLEVGTSSPLTLYWHLFNSGSVARWPYGCENIYLLTLKKEVYNNDFKGGGNKSIPRRMKMFAV